MLEQRLPASVQRSRRPAGSHPGAWTVLYDAECGFCIWILSGLLRWDRAGRLRPRALAGAEADSLLADLQTAERMASWHLISPAGRRRTGGAAVVQVLRLLPSGRMPAAVLARFPGFTEGVYRWVADHRSQLSRLAPAAAKRNAAGRVQGRIDQETTADVSPGCNLSGDAETPAVHGRL